MSRYSLIRLAKAPQDQLTDQERDELKMMKTIIYEETIQQVHKLFLECFKDVKEDVENFILALQYRDIPAIRQAIQKVLGFDLICDHGGLLDAEPDLWINNNPRDTADQSDKSATLPACT